MKLVQQIKRMFEPSAAKVQTLKDHRTVSRDGLALRFITMQTPELCLRAVMQNSDALQHVYNQTETICIIAVNRNGLALRFVKNQSYAICSAAVKQNSDALQYVRDTDMLEYCKSVIELTNRIQQSRT